MPGHLAGYSTQPVIIADLMFLYRRAGKLPFCWGRTAVVNRRYLRRWPG